MTPYGPQWIINCHIEMDFWLQVLTDWDRGDYWVLTPESAYYTLDDSLIVNLPRREPWWPVRTDLRVIH